MKNVNTLFALLLAFVLSSSVAAQDCDFYSMDKGTVFGYQNLDAKGKETGSTRTTCLDVQHVGGSMIYKVKSEFSEPKNKNQSSREYDMRCEGGKFYIDMQSFIDPKAMESFKDMEISAESTDMLYPAGLSVGQTLPDANITISAASGGVAIMNMVVSISNRKVVGMESVTVPAGTFECYKLTYDAESKMIFKVNTSVTEYISRGIGSVKTETFDKKGKSLGTTILTELIK